MKIYVHYEPAAASGSASAAASRASTASGEAKGAEDEGALTLKLTLPKKWLAQPVSQVLELFLESYNQKKRPPTPLEPAAVHIEKAGYVGGHGVPLAARRWKNGKDTCVHPQC